MNRARHALLCALGLAAATLNAVACSSLDASTSARFGDGGASDDAQAGDGSFGDAAVATPFAVNALVLVHAASYPAFRVCFDQGLANRPLPDTDVMADSNVVGIDVGTAVRLPPPSTMLGRAFIYPELSLRALYPALGGSGPTCQQLLDSNQPGYTQLGTITDDLSFGAHALVLTGCQSATLDRQASTTRCGEDWVPASGNLRFTVIGLDAYTRVSGGLALQVLQLSPSFAAESQGRAVGVAFGALDAGEAGSPLPFLERELPFGMPVPDPPAVVPYASDDLALYPASGLVVSLGGALDAGDDGDDAGRTIVLAESLEEIQHRSSSRSLPPDWFAVASSYVVLSVGDRDPRTADGGVDPDPRRALHLLAIPLAAPDVDAAASP